MEDQPKGQILYQNPGYKPENKEPYNVRLTPTVKGQIKALAQSSGKSEADIITSAIHALLMDTPTVEQRATEIRTLIGQQANELYWSHQDAEKMPQAEFDLYAWLMKVDGELDQFISQAAEQGE